MTTGESTIPSNSASRPLDVATLAVAVIGAVVGIPAAFEMLPGWAADVSAIVGPLLLVTVGLLVVASLPWAPATGRAGWQAIGVGVAVLGVGSLLVEVSDPTEVAAAVDFVGAGVALIGVAVIVFGLIRLPHLRLTRFGSAVAVLDSGAGAVAAFALLWHILDGDRLADLGRLDLVVYPALDAVLLGALLTALLRRSPYQGDRRLVAFASGMIAVLIADAATPILVAEGSYSSEHPIHGLWLLGVSAFAISAWYLRRPVARREVGLGRSPVWKYVVPYALVTGLIVIFLTGLASDSMSSVTGWALIVVVALIVVRQAISIRESRIHVEMERDQLLASVSHELRTPLTAVSGFAEVLGGRWEEFGDPERQDIVEIVREQSGELVTMITDMVRLARGHLDSVDLNVTRFDGKQMIADAIRGMFDPTAGPLPIKAQVEPYLEFTADRERVLQMMHALMLNAQRFGDGQILLVARRTDDGRLLEIHDNGDGVPPRYEKVIWERFERGAHRLNASVPGSGLGLAIVQALAHAHGGRAGYRQSSRLGGACFWVELPYDSEAAVVRENRQPQTAGA